MANKIESNHKVDPIKVPLETDQGIIESEERKWRLPFKDVYKYGLSFFKDKEGKALHISYEDRLKLVAYTQQAAHGALDPNSVQPLGVLDVIGRDRRVAWQALGNMSQVQAMAGFVHSLDRLCPLFKPYIEAIQKDLENKKQIELKKEAERKSHQELESRIILEKQKQQSKKLTEEQQVQRIKDALNTQTYQQFLQYAQHQFPGNCDQQAVLIRQLQDQHYQQYIQQLAVDQRLANSNLIIRDESENELDNEKRDFAKDENSNEEENVEGAEETKSRQCTEKSDIAAHNNETREEDDDDSYDGLPTVEEARMWTRGEVNQFKESARAGGGTLTVSQGQCCTVRVPTHHRARSICWEFATDNYDIGFGIYFEWSKSPTSDVTVHLSESDEDDPDNEACDDDDFNSEYENEDPEVGHERLAVSSARPLVSVVVPVYRRDCHTEVYSGSHNYPGEGVYLLKFDNTYSMWRSKTIYYKVYYTQ